MSKLWTDIQRAWSRMGPPLRPNAEVVAGIRDCLAQHRQKLLILGVTPEFADLADDVIAVDSSPNMIAAIWPGDTDRRKVLEGNWLNLPCDAESRESAVCDGGLTLLPFPDGYEAVFAELSRVLQPGGRGVLRVFCVPSPCETLDELEASTWNGELQTIHALKFRLAMARVAQNDQVNIAMRDVWDDFASLFPDRQKLADATGWTGQAIDTIDFYRDSGATYSYPTGDQLLEVARPYFADVSLVSVGTYEMADRCPLLVLDKA